MSLFIYIFKYKVKCINFPCVIVELCFCLILCVIPWKMGTTNRSGLYWEKKNAFRYPRNNTNAIMHSMLTVNYYDLSKTSLGICCIMCRQPHKENTIEVSICFPLNSKNRVHFMMVSWTVIFSRCPLLCNGLLISLMW
jgi:hypothetical protein